LEASVIKVGSNPVAFLISLQLGPAFLVAVWLLLLLLLAGGLTLPGRSGRADCFAIQREVIKAVFPVFADPAPVAVHRPLVLGLPPAPYSRPLTTLRVVMTAAPGGIGHRPGPGLGAVPAGPAGGASGRGTR